MLDRSAKFEVTIKRVLRITNYFYWFKLIITHLKRVDTVTKLFI